MPVWVVLNHTDSELVVLSTAVSASGTDTMPPLPSKLTAVPDVLLWPATHVGAVPPLAVLVFQSTPMDGSPAELPSPAGAT